MVPVVTYQFNIPPFRRNTFHTGKFFNRVLLLTAFHTALFTTVHAANINLSLGTPATQSRNYYETVRYHASNAVNGDTPSVWYTR